MRTGAVPKAANPTRESERLARDSVTWPRTREPRPDQRLDATLPIRRDHRLHELRVRRRLRRIVAAAHVHFDVTKALVLEVCLQELERSLGCHVRHEAHVDLRDR